MSSVQCCCSIATPPRQPEFCVQRASNEAYDRLRAVSWFVFSDSVAVFCRRASSAFRFALRASLRVCDDERPGHAVPTVLLWLFQWFSGHSPTKNVSSTGGCLGRVALDPSRQTCCNHWCACCYNPGPFVSRRRRKRCSHVSPFFFRNGRLLLQMWVGIRKVAGNGGWCMYVLFSGAHAAAGVFFFNPRVEKTGL